MPTDDDRREVARRLRKCTPPTSYRQAQGGGWAHLCDMALAVGLKREDNPTAWELAQRLADLIEPSESGQNRDRNQDSVQKESHIVQIDHECDRDALLGLVKELELGAQCAVGRKWSNVECERMSKHLADDYEMIARRIRKALGVDNA